MGLAESDAYCDFVKEERSMLLVVLPFFLVVFFFSSSSSESDDLVGTSSLRRERIAKALFPLLIVF